MKIDLTGRNFLITGAETEIAAALGSALAANGGQAVAAPTRPDLLIVSLPLDPDSAFDAGPLLRQAEAVAAEMAAGDGGRLLFLVSALASLPMRRNAEQSAMMATALATARTIAMRHGPKVLSNAVGIGAIGAPVIAGDEAMIDHTAFGRPGRVEDVVAAALFLLDPLNSYTTGQILNVDGGWSTGYGRHF